MKKFCSGFKGPLSYALAGICLSLGLSASTLAQAIELAAPNVVPVSEQLISSGQPTARALEGLGAQGIDAVIYLAPPNVSDAVRDEHLIVSRQGLTFVNIPIIFNNPTTKDFDTFAGILQSLGDKKVLVHCQVNMRASTMVFLYRVVIGKEDPVLAYEAVSKVWAPSGPWKKLMLDVLQKHKVNFEPY
ncbi:protein tyrosine phosphatase family protein [Undibacterium sp. TJN19]|uniref:protein tyrosine phosphatase family protein n=1 Tax=Undibacterium sp. TJN19 TaxID=3413055 RepID=UPI003BF0BC2D